MCYHMAITAKDQQPSNKSDDTDYHTGKHKELAITDGGRQHTPNHTSALIAANQASKDDQLAVVAKEKIMAKKSLSVQPQYNICEHYLNAKTFPLVLAKCSTILAMFDDMLSERLITCYGHDERRKQLEDEPVEEERDFSWILKAGAAPKDNLRNNTEW